MGVKGFWKLVESTGSPVPLETLEHKVLGVDVSIWLHQAVKGFRGPGGGAVANAHLLTLFHRICKLMYYRIRPVFVFDGGVPHLKKQTAASRRIKREAAASEAMKVRKRLLGNLLKSQAVRNALGKKGPGPSSFHIEQPKKREKDMFELPPLPVKAEVTDEGATLVKTEEDSDDEEAQILRNMKLPNLHNFDFESDEFKNLPMETQHEILSELQDTRKENSWGTMNKMPHVSTDFSDFQMKRLLKRRNFQSYLDELREKIKKQNTAEIEAQLYFDLEKHVSFSETYKIASEDSTHSILIKTGDDKEKHKAEILEDIKKCKGKSLMKKENKVDFLTHFHSQGLVSNHITGQFSGDSDENMDDEDLNYEHKLSPGDMEEINETAFAQVCNFLADNSGLTQDEILALIEQQNESKASGDGFNDQPTSSSKAQGIVFNPDADSSDDDSNFVEIQERSLPRISDHSEPQQVKSSVKTEPPENQNYNRCLNSSNEHTIEKEKDSTSNVDAILSTKTNSMYLKIVQSRLDDIIHSSENSSSKKAFVDTRKFNSPQKDVPAPQELPKRETVAISLDFDLNPLKREDDIFADIFESESSHISNTSFEPKKRPAPLQRISVDKVTMPSAKSSNQKSGTCMREMSELKKKETPGSATKNKKTCEMIRDGRNESLSKSEGQCKSSLLEKKTKMTDNEYQSSAVSLGGVQPVQLDTTVKIDPDIRAKVDSLVRQEIGKLIDTLKADQENLKQNGQEQNKTKESTKRKEDARIMSQSESDSEEDTWTFKSKVINGIKCDLMSNERNSKVDSRYEIDKAKDQVSPASDAEFMSSSESEDEDVDEENEKAAVLEKEKPAYVEKGKEERNSVLSFKELRPACNEEEKRLFVKKLGVSKVVHTSENSTEKSSNIEGKMNIKEEDVDSDDDDFIEVEEAGSSSLGKELSENSTRKEKVDIVPSGERGINEGNEEIDESTSHTSGNQNASSNAYIDGANVNDESNVERPMNYTNEELKQLEIQLANEQETLVAQAKKVDRVASNLNDQMYGEAQELLQLFGIPYLVAPMEAEAQCAFLDRTNLTHGTITDDSDVFLFGGTRVYKNFFNHNKHVEFFTANNIQFNIGLDRDKMIALAMLTGSDYTDGIESVGAVSAMEILSEFPGEGVECLKNLKKWWSVASNSVLPTYESKIKQKLAQLSLKESFPSEAVFKAYLEAEVDESKERFSWAVPNTDALHTFTLEKFGWSNSKTNEILVPIMKRLGINETQMRIDSYYTKIKLVKENQIQSKRMQEAISRVKGETSPVKTIVNPKEKKSAQNRNKSQKRKQDALCNDEEMLSSSEGNSGPTTSRTLLVDPNEVAAMKKGRKVKSAVKRNSDQDKKVVKKQNKTMIPMVEENVDQNDDITEDPPKVLTKAEAKEKIYKGLLEKERIEQREKGKQEMIDKKRKAAELLQNIKLDPKKKKR
ncbi:rad2 superfamily protein mus201 [Oratosquilla oratoria]|uniref:rad2 superfamily protein mus201 n=1 Tax=Oratosquilla oratoria TaxID=337810 RepID=UPI003F77523F